MGPCRSGQRAGFLLRHATLRWQRGITAALGPRDLTHAEFVLLASTWSLNAHDQRPNQIALVAHAGIDVQTTS